MRLPASVPATLLMVRVAPVDEVKVQTVGFAVGGVRVESVRRLPAVVHAIAVAVGQVGAKRRAEFGPEQACAVRAHLDLRHGTERRYGRRACGAGQGDDSPIRERLRPCGEIERPPRVSMRRHLCRDIDASLYAVAHLPRDGLGEAGGRAYRL